MPKGIFERTEKHKEQSRLNGQKVKGKKPVNAILDVNYKIGFLTIVERLAPIGAEIVLWLCKCECGNSIERTSNALLRRDSTKHCGCVKPNRPYNFKGYEEITGAYWYRVKREAEQRKLVFEITMKDVWDLYIKQNKKCVLSGIDIDFFNKTASIDRINSKKGYTLDNIQIIHKNINRMKVDFDQKYFIDICKLIAENNK